MVPVHLVARVRLQELEDQLATALHEPTLEPLGRHHLFRHRPGCEPGWMARNSNMGSLSATIGAALLVKMVGQRIVVLQEPTP